jgi:hypothetical protein
MRTKYEVDTDGFVIITDTAGHRTSYCVEGALGYVYALGEDGCVTQIHEGLRAIGPVLTSSRGRLLQDLRRELRRVRAASSIPPLTLKAFKQLFWDHGRAHQFSDAGFEVLFDRRNRHGVDVIELCCAFAEVSEDELKECIDPQIVAKLPNRYLVETQRGLNHDYRNY